MGADPSPSRGWRVVAAGAGVNLCLGILYAWSVWKGALAAKPDRPAGTPLEGADAGWHALSDVEATAAYSLCGLTFAAAMVPGGRLQDRLGPRLGATLAGLALGAGCVVAGLMRNFAGLLLGFGLLGGVGMGLGYAAATPAAVRWFGPHRRGLIVGLVVAGYGAAAVYIAPLGNWLIAQYGVSGSFVGLGLLFALTITVLARFLTMPPAGYVPPAGPLVAARPAGPDVPPAEVLRDRNLYLLIALFAASAQAGLLLIANAVPILQKTAAADFPFLARNAWLLASFGGVVNALGRVGTGFYSDRLGRANAYALNAAVAALALFAAPFAVQSGSVPLLVLLVGVAFWQYGGTLSLMPALTADLYGAKNLGANYGLVFLGWGLAFLGPLVAGAVKDATGTLDPAFYGSGALLLLGVAGSRLARRA